LSILIDSFLQVLALHQNYISTRVTGQKTKKVPNGA